jgi:beta-N-acetylhexosaminidase
VTAILSAIFGCAGPVLGDAERDFFKAANPLGFILFGRNCDNPAQLKALTSDLRSCLDRENIPILIDQEGGRVARLKPPHWRKAPAAAAFGQMYKVDPDRAFQSARLNASLMGQELRELGINVDCAPLLDLTFDGASDVIGNRSYSDDPDVVATLGRAVCEGLIEAGVLPVIKHLPGHGRALVDSHFSLPVVDTKRAELNATDFVPFKALADMPLGMSAHIVFTDIDPDNPATTSRRVIDDVIRGEIGFEGLLMGDDLSMEALDGSIDQRGLASIAAGCDVVLHCNGKFDEMQAVAAALPALTSEGLGRWQRASAIIEEQSDTFSEAVENPELLAVLADMTVDII